MSVRRWLRRRTLHRKLQHAAPAYIGTLAPPAEIWHRERGVTALAMKDGQPSPGHRAVYVPIESRHGGVLIIETGTENSAPIRFDGIATLIPSGALPELAPQPASELRFGAFIDSQYVDVRQFDFDNPDLAAASFRFNGLNVCITSWRTSLDVALIESLAPISLKTDFT